MKMHGLSWAWADFNCRADRAWRGSNNVHALKKLAAGVFELAETHEQEETTRTKMGAEGKRELRREDTASLASVFVGFNSVEASARR